MMEKTCNNKLAELILARESLKKKTLEKTASAEDTRQLEIINKEIAAIEGE